MPVLAPVPDELAEAPHDPEGQCDCCGMYKPEGTYRLEGDDICLDCYLPGED